MIRTIIVDDEPLARQLIREYLQGFPEIAVVGECRNGRQAIKAINQEKPDLVFLDIRMPGIDGFGVLEQLHCVPRVIFSTAHDDFALRAFEVNAVDYLLKPYDRQRFARAVRRVLKEQEPPDQGLDRVLGLMQHAREAAAFPVRIYVRVGRKIVSVLTADILFIEAEGDYSSLHTAGGSYLSNLSLTELERRMDPGRFVRVHRAFIVAHDAVQHLTSDGEGGFVATMRNNATVKVSRTYADRIKSLIW
jgi:two-component system LytT family response regulator